LGGKEVGSESEDEVFDGFSGDDEEILVDAGI
jgi:hypothetical protein